MIYNFIKKLRLLIKVFALASFTLTSFFAFSSPLLAFNEHDLKQMIQILKYCNKTNPKNINIYKNIRKIEIFNDLKKIAADSKILKQKLKYDLLNGFITKDKYTKLENDTNHLTQILKNSSKIPEDQIGNFICEEECNGPETPTQCDTLSFVYNFLEASAEETPYVWADSKIYNYFIKSQEAIESKDYNKMCENFNAIHNLVDKYIKKIPDCTSCPEGYCESCEAIQGELYNEFSFLKLYMETQKGYYYIVNNEFGKAEEYFKKLLNELIAQAPESNPRKSIKKNEYIENMGTWHKPYLIKNCYFFMGYVQMLQKRYAEAGESFYKYHYYGGYYQDFKRKLHSTLVLFPRSGLYKDYCNQDRDRLRENILFPSSIIKLSDYTFYYMGVCNENLGNKNLAIGRYKEYISKGDVDYLNDAQKRILELENNVSPIVFSNSDYEIAQGDKQEYFAKVNFDQSQPSLASTKGSSFQYTITIENDEIATISKHYSTNEKIIFEIEALNTGETQIAIEIEYSTSVSRAKKIAKVPLKVFNNFKVDLEYNDQPLLWNRIVPSKNENNFEKIKVKVSTDKNFKADILNIFVVSNLTLGDKPEKAIPITLKRKPDTSIFEGFIELNEKIISNKNSSKTSISAVDFLKLPYKTSNNDSIEFVNRFKNTSNFIVKDHAYLIDVNNPDQNILKKVPYPNIDFLKSGGVETVKVTTSYVKYKNLPKVLPVFNAEATSYFLVKSPADWFYVSGEGYHDKKAFCYSYEANGNTSVIPLADFTNDLGKNKHKFIIFACCSLMDIYFNGVYRDPSLSDATFNNEANPGLHILNDIAKNSNDIIILGYAGTAPGTGSDVNILNNFLKIINFNITDKDFVAKTWLNVNKNKPYFNFNARAFVKNNKNCSYYLIKYTPKRRPFDKLTINCENF